MSVHPRFAMAFWLMSETLSPRTMATVRPELTKLATKLGLGRKVVVEMHLIGVHRQEREPGVVSRGDRSA